VDWHGGKRKQLWVFSRYDLVAYTVRKPERISGWRRSVIGRIERSPERPPSLFTCSPS